MIQIIGFLLCAMLAVKLLEMSANSALLDEQGKPHHNRTAALILGWPCVFGFAFWLVMQGGAFEEPTLPPMSDEEQACISRAQSADEAEACAR